MTHPAPDPVEEAAQAREADALVERRLTVAQHATQLGLHTDPHLHTLLHNPDHARTGRRAS